MTNNFINKFIYETNYNDMEVKFHWSVLLTMLAAVYYNSHSIFTALISCAGAILIILLHEFGHYYMARRYRCEVYEIVVHYLGGYCVHEEPYTQYEDSMIAFGGVFAQLLLVVGSLVILGFLSLMNIPLNLVLYSLLINIFIMHNLFIIAFNLLPIPGFDGHSAWHIFRYVDIKLPGIDRLKKYVRDNKSKTEPTLSREEVKNYADKFIKDAITEAKKNK
ncbi:MAG: hypothetical protein GY754_26600 [bacterium]|nr:hypothetical protein [bacterium]